MFEKLVKQKDLTPALASRIFYNSDSLFFQLIVRCGKREFDLKSKALVYDAERIEKYLLEDGSFSCLSVSNLKN